MRATPTYGRGIAHAVAMGALLLFGAACQEQSHITEANELSTVPLFASSNSLPHINNSNLAMPTTISVELTADDCSNNPGPRITFSGLTALGGFGVEMVFSNNMKGTHEYSADNTVETTVLPAGEAISIPKQPVLGGTGGNPFIWVQFMNGDGTAATEEIFAGRCVQGSTWRHAGPASTAASAWANFAIESCENSPGPYISMGSGMALAGLSVDIIFRNNDNPVGGPHENGETRQTVVMIEPGLSFTFPKQPVLGGVGGNPWIFAGFSDGAGVSLGENTLLGRCEQLSKALSD